MCHKTAKTKTMGNKIFRISYFIFLVSLIAMLLLSSMHVISFGVDVGDSLTRVMIVIIIFISLFIFLPVNKSKSETLFLNALRMTLILLMLVIIIFLVNDFTSRL